MMKRIVSLLFAIVLIFSILPNTSAKASVMWGKTELRNGQIGKVTILQDSQLWKFDKDNKTLVEVRKLNKGEEYRVYSYRNDLGGLYGVGEGSFIKKSAAAKYETPSKAKLQALGVKVAKANYQDVFQYPQVEGLLNSTAQKNINDVLQKHIESSYKSALEVKKSNKEDPDHEYSYEVSYEVKYNKNNLLSILIYDYTYTGGAHGITTVQSYNFDVRTGNQIALTNVAENKSELTKLMKYTKADLLNQNKKIGMVFTDQLDDLTFDNSRPFYFYDNGIVVKFQHYEAAAYAAGMLEVKVPYSVFR
ncbi:DUF3298 and DUF4163 domain-containing protein [Bacillus sp. FJAT-49705]|uniref:DUF3298 and DUF4163 domain-containing protein n=1 Tax=Cytobacillus citreus TaxID=2833586 RepID=A0ABS5NQU6_9BACI|nr:DUF3298 and DUF4163 domain-containing protein [Cytobacillus citreus]MBS4190195.1 DUF3298 and DUF4163 domain-containing protein [Cytobacillus citreus]